MSRRTMVFITALVGLHCGDHNPTANSASVTGGSASGTTVTPSTSTTASADSSTSGADSTGGVTQRPPCANRNPERNVYWGDLHVHTAFSFDAWLHDVRTDPDLAYQFARGATIQLPPLDKDGVGTQSVALARPLDFAAVTDHAEFLAEVEACTVPGNPAYDSALCTEYRTGSFGALAQFGLQLQSANPSRFPAVCGDDGIDCDLALRDVWQRTRDAAEAAYDQTDACEFTSFVGYEWSGATLISNLHRNVIFRNNIVPEAPISYYEAKLPSELWTQLDAQCNEGLEGCEVLAIPHNANWSNGNQFIANYPKGEDEAEAAALRGRLEPLYEVFQHKGDSECSNGLSGITAAPDEFCDFEKLRTPPFEDCGDGVGAGGMTASGCVSRLDFARGILLEGLTEAQRIGVNPYKVGLMASTDTHNGTAGLVNERQYVGHVGVQEAEAVGRLTGIVPAGARNNPGGLVAVWAEENTRDSLFDAMQRRETYGTSGPRISLRMFGGWDLPEGLCEQADLVSVGYADGVAMGGQLSGQPGGAGGPRFVVSALADPGVGDDPATPLQRAQIVKGWLDGAGERHIEVFDVAGGDNGASVDPLTCEPQGAGEQSLCGVWTDPGFDPDQPAFYYARVLENPVCRWSTRDCLALGKDAPAVCTDGSLPETIQERAWSSPIWY